MMKFTGPDNLITEFGSNSEFSGTNSIIDKVDVNAFVFGKYLAQLHIYYDIDTRSIYD